MKKKQQTEATCYAPTLFSKSALNKQCENVYYTLPFYCAKYSVETTPERSKLFELILFKNVIEYALNKGSYYRLKASEKQNNVDFFY